MGKPILFKPELVRAIMDGYKRQTRRAMKGQPPKDADVDAEIAMLHNRPRYKVGDVLFVRETWSIVPVGEFRELVYVYKADNPTGALKPKKWRPSIHMPTEAARLFLKITNVRAERVQYITETDAAAEGCVAKPARYNLPAVSARDEFAKLWDSVADEGGGWDANPFVFIYEFDIVEVKNVG